MATLPSNFEDLDGSGAIEPDEQWVAYMLLAEQEREANRITSAQFHTFLVNRGKYYNFPIAEGTSLESLCLESYEPADQQVPYTPHTPPKKLSFNNGNLPIPSSNDQVTLREYEGGPMAQQDAEFNFINITDRVNTLIDNSASTDAALSSSIDATNKIISEINFALDNLSQNQNAINEGLSQAQADIITNSESVPTQLNTPENELVIGEDGNVFIEQNKKFLFGTKVGPEKNSRGDPIVTALNCVNVQGDGADSLLVNSIISGRKVNLKVAGTITAEQLISTSSGNLDLATIDARLKAVEQDTSELTSQPRGFTFLDEEVMVNDNEDGKKTIDLRPHVPAGATTGIFSMRQPKFGEGFVHTPTMEIRFYTNASFAGTGHSLTLQVNDRGITAGEQFMVPMVDRRCYIHIMGDTWSSRTSHVVYFHGYQ